MSFDVHCVEAKTPDGKEFAVHVNKLTLNVCLNGKKQFAPALYVASEKGHKDIVREILLRKDVEVNLNQPGLITSKINDDIIYLKFVNNRNVFS